MAESAFIAHVPEAEPHVAHLRGQFDPSAKLGVPAHITLLYPFMSPELLSASVFERVRVIVSRSRRFVFTLSRVDRFPGVVYLAPDPAAPFMELTRRLVNQFPQFLPYGDAHEAIVPHLTVARGSDAENSRVEAELRESLSDGIACTCSEVVLIENASGRWRQMHAFPLAPSAHVAG